MTTFALVPYFDRIASPVPDMPSLENLKQLHRLHVMSIPFENLDIHYPHPIVLEEDRFFDKIVRRQRGGFCYEQNGLLCKVLQQLGYQAFLISASVYQVDDAEFGPPDAHVAIIVEIKEQHWLVDVGFGSSFPEPLPLVTDQPQEQDGVVYVIKSSDDNNFVLDRSYDNGQSYTPMYRFDLTPCKLDHFREMCHFHKTSEASPLFQKKLISIAKPGGRITLTNRQLIITQGEDRQETAIEGEADFQEKLSEYFGFGIVEGKVQSKFCRPKINTKT
jgi:N-hydroxyarylamine O-acetyltransferase